MEVSKFTDLGIGNESTYLPKLTEIARSNFLLFPVESENCQPIRIPGVKITTPRFSIFDFRQCRLDGFRLYEQNKKYFTDTSIVSEKEDYSRELDEKFDRGLREGLQLDPETGAIIRKQPAIVLDKVDCLLFCSDEPSNFGSWVYRIIPKIALSLVYRQPRSMFGYAKAPWMMSILSTLFPGIEVIQHNPRLSYSIKNAIIPSLPTPGAHFRPEVREQFSMIADRFRGGPTGFEKIYVSRRKQAIKRPGLRVMESETELVERLAVAGYREFFPEEYSISDQIRIFSQAKVIVGSGGSNMFGCCFARNAELIVDIESARTWTYAHSNVMASSGRPFTMVRGSQNERGIGGHRNWTVDVDTLITGLKILDVV